MRTDLRYKLTLAAIITLIPTVLILLSIFFIATESICLALIPIYLFAGAFLITFILSFVPFMKDHMWLSAAASVLVAAIAGVIIHLLV